MMRSDFSLNNRCVVSFPRMISVPGRQHLCVRITGYEEVHMIQCTATNVLVVVFTLKTVPISTQYLLTSSRVPVYGTYMDCLL